MGKKCIVLFSGGLDSRLAVKIMLEQGFEVLSLFFKLPFGVGCCNEGCSFNFAQKHGINLKIIDCTKGKYLQEYLEIIKSPVFRRGKGLNPCIDCRVFMLKKAKELADKENIDLIVTGEVLGERPMSQMKKTMGLVEEVSGLKGRLLRPLSAKFFEETNAEKKGIVNRNKLYDIQGRRRGKQIKLAEKFKIDYPSPAGGCLLCEKALIKRIEFLLKRGLNEWEAVLIGVGRHFVVDGKWVVLGKNHDENKIIEIIGGKAGELIIPNFPGPSALILDKHDDKIKNKVKELIKAYSKKGSLKERKSFDKWKL